MWRIRRIGGATGSAIVAYPVMAKRDVTHAAGFEYHLAGDEDGPA
jgi:hypothetical protein